MFFDAGLALETLTELEPQVRAAAERLLPGAVTLLVPNPAHRFPLACGPDPGTLGLRVPAFPPALQALRGVAWPVLQSSANLAGGPDARTVDAVPAGIRREADLVLDGGPLPGTPSTVIDLRGYEADGTWSIVRQGAAPESWISSQLAA
jgi:L-threonylcarbamoyladenylate synthase